MLFNSPVFLAFMVVVFVVYWLVLNKSLRIQNLFLLVCSYFFYGWWDWRFLFLLFISSSVDYVVGQLISATDKPLVRKRYLTIAISINLIILGFFKYFNFFYSSAIDFLSLLGFKAHPLTLQILLPVGISFYTFQSMGYAIDVYRKHVEPARSYISFLAFVSFFPHMVAGPIMRAKDLLPQFYEPRVFNYEAAKNGLRLILWGLFKKMVIADNAAKLADLVFNNASTYSGLEVLSGTLAFTIQIYGDFSGYSDMAVGIARLLGFELIFNFRKPYFATSVRDFWQRWHIALSNWFKDYVYLPLGGNRVSEPRNYVNLLLTFIISGLWHGANYTFLVWGLWHGLASVAETWINRHLKLSLPRFLSWVLTFSIVTLGWIFFRALSLNDALQLISNLFDFTDLEQLTELFEKAFKTLSYTALWVVCVALLFLSEYLLNDSTPDVAISRLSRPFRWTIYYVLLLCIVILGISDQAPNFIYFKF